MARTTAHTLVLANDSLKPGEPERRTKARAPLSGEDVLPFSALSEKTQRLVEQVQQTKRPLFITRQGHSAAVLMDAEEYAS